MKQCTGPRQAGHSANPHRSVARVNIRGSNASLYVVSAFFILESIDALGIIDRSIYGAWPGKSGDKVTQTLHSASVAKSPYGVGVNVSNGTNGAQIASHRVWVINSHILLHRRIILRAPQYAI